LLFQIDISAAGFIRTFGGKDPYTDQAKQQLPGAFRIIDPMDWEDPKSPAYWRNILSKSYMDDVAELWKNFRENFIKAAEAGEIRLRTSHTGAPFMDITPLVRQISGYSNSLETFNNNLTLVLGPDEKRLSSSVFISFRQDGAIKEPNTPNPSVKELMSLSESDISENDVIMVRTSRDGGPYELEFLGFVGKVVSTSNYGEIFTKTVQVFGISKLFSVSTIIKQQSIQDRFAQGAAGFGVSISNQETPSNYEHRFQGMTAKEVFSTLLREVLAWKQFPLPKDGETAQTPATGEPENPNATLYNIDTSTSVPTTGETFSFQFNVFTLMTLLLMAKTQAITLPANEAKLYNQGAPKTDPRQNIPSLLDKKALAIMEHGDHKVWNEMVASGYENFFSQTVPPGNIFSELRSTTLYDVFEARNGTIIARPPRYNRIENSIDDYRREFLDSTGGVNKIFVFKTDGNLGARFEFNPEADFFIKSNLTISDIDSQREDFDLESRADVKWTMPLVGPQDFPAGEYTDPNLLVKYGLRTRGPIDNPNVTNENMAKLFAPVYLGMTNAKTRMTSVTVLDTRKFYLGKLYYIQDIGQVGYLVSDEIVHTYGQVSKHNMEFSMLRNVIWVSIKEIMESDNAILDFAMIYLKDPTPEELAKQNQTASQAVAQSTSGKGSRVVTTLMQDLIERGKTALRMLSSVGNGDGTKIPMFKYVPTIMDVIIQVDNDPYIVWPDRANQDKSEQSKVDSVRNKEGFRQAVCLGGRFFATLMPFTPLTLPSGAVSVKKIHEVTKNSAQETEGWGDFNPLAGVMGYEGVDDKDLESFREPSTDGKSGRPYFYYNRDGSKAPLTATPFYSVAISQDPSDFLFSQVLINKLTVLDLTLKYRLAPGVGKKFIPNTVDGFPQYYWAVPGSQKYRLFGSSLFPSTYVDKNRPFGVAFLDFIMTNGGPNTLFLKNNGSSWESDSFAIRSIGSNQFNMPYGHIVTLSKTDASHDFRLPAFFRLSGGTYEMKYDKSGKSLIVKGVSSTAKIFDEQEFAAQENANITNINKRPSIADIIKKENENKELAIPIDPSLPSFCFLSPYLEPTIERIFELGLPSDLCGYRKKAKTNELVEKAIPLRSVKGPYTAENDPHCSGLAFDIALESVTYASGADIEILPRAWERLEIALTKRCKLTTYRIDDINNLSIDWVYPDGKPGRDSPAPVRRYYHIVISEEESQAYADAANTNWVLAGGGTVIGARS
jgi:hypothetical protein